MKAKDVLTKLGITRPTLCSYVKKGYITAIKLPNGQYDYDISSFLNASKAVSEIRIDAKNKNQEIDITVEIYKVLAEFLRYMNDINLADSKYYTRFMELVTQLPNWK